MRRETVVRKPLVSRASGTDELDTSVDGAATTSRAMNAVVCVATAATRIERLSPDLCVGHASLEHANADIVRKRMAFIGGFLARFRGLKKHQKASLKAADECAPPGSSHFAQFCALPNIIHTNMAMRIDKTTVMVI
ncbi:hypothetical protein FHX57_000159 [Paraburkholderia tropica]|uniref:hypothetical protein n=1 Tax=Paraburkholderia tropica TaxID=92647 RepID=UPI00160CB097|nr:hypothetical protein [Paraburkholderia tropica]MBB2997846.1 hypothetical protein [Paraburkholderia tropica]MBB6316868.1 hypothetical protein [Paraburkholderia tropica]